MNCFYPECGPFQSVVSGPGCCDYTCVGPDRLSDLTGVCVCVCVCVRACVRVCMHMCMRACVTVTVIVIF